MVDNDKPTDDDSGRNSPSPSYAQLKLKRPEMLRFHSTPVLTSTNYMSPTRQQFRLGNTRPREIKETMDAKYRSDKFGKTVIINQYKLQKDIARAAYGSVRVAVNEECGTKYAVKEYSKRQLQKASRMAMMKRRRRGDKTVEGDFSPLGLIRHEVAIMKKLDHPNIVSLVEVLDDPHGDALYMILDWCEKGAIMNPDHEEPSPYCEEQVRLIFRDVILAVEYLHSQGVIHRDIKVDNILMDEEDVVKLVDFGVSEIFEQDNDIIKKTAGSPAYMAPELAQLSNGSNIEQVQQVAGRPADLWSMGVVLYFLLTGKQPFQADTLMELFDCIIHGQPDLSLFDSDLRDLFTRLLEKDPSKRMKMEELREHAWVTCQGQDPLLSKQENTSDDIAPITEEDLQCAFEQIEGKVDTSHLNEKLKRLHGWRGTTIKSRESSPESMRSRSSTPPMEDHNFSRLSRALDEIVNKRSVSNGPSTHNSNNHHHLQQRQHQHQHQQRRRGGPGSDDSNSSDDSAKEDSPPTPPKERRRSRSRTRQEDQKLRITSLIDAESNRSKSLDPGTKL